MKIRYVKGLFNINIINFNLPMLMRSPNLQHMKFIDSFLKKQKHFYLNFI